MASEHLINQNQQVQKGIRDMEELFALQDTFYDGKMKELSEQRQQMLIDRKEEFEKLRTTLFGEYGEIEAELEQTRQEKAELEQEMKVLRTTMASREEKIQQEMEQTHQEKAELEQEIEVLRKTMASREDEVQQEMKQTRQQKAELEQEVGILQKTLASRGEEIQQEFKQIQKRKAELEQEVGVLRKTLASHGDDDRRKMKDVECMRESLKAISEKNKQLQKELDKKMDIEAEHAALKSSAIDVDRENERLKAENIRLKKQFNAAESRADENAHLLSKAETARINMQLAVAAESRVEQDAHFLSNATVSQVEFNRGVQGNPDRSIIQSTPRPIFKHRTASQSTPRPILKHRTASLPRVNRVPSSSSTVKTETLPPKDTPAVRKRGILLDFSEPVNRKRLDFKVQKLSENNRDRQMHHLKSHYDPVTGAYDQSHGESPKTAARLTTPTKGNSFLTSIFRR